MSADANSPSNHSCARCGGWLEINKRNYAAYVVCDPCQREDKLLQAQTRTLKAIEKAIAP